MVLIVYIDSDYKCHLAESPEYTRVETDLFDGKCAAFVEGCRYVPEGETWVREDGEVFTGLMIAPWVDSRVLESAQRGYEEAMASMALLQAENQDMAAALAVLGVQDE